jgi:hypothetical protein
MKDENVVANFLCSLGGLTQAEALANLALDARAYRWNTATCRAIRLGIMRARLDSRGQR